MMFDHISNRTARACLEALVQLNAEDNPDAILSFVDGIEDAAGNPLGEMLLMALAQVAKYPIRQPES